MHVGYADEVPEEYGKALDKAKSLDELRSVVRRYAEVAYDAMLAVDEWTTDDFDDWRHALSKERKGKFMGDKFAERFSCVLMPEAMFKVAIVASEFHVPWGLAYHRLKDAGKLTIKNEIATVQL